ncbi:flagellar basal body rod protein FlgB [Spongiibacter sp. KMU-158]|uniref:Flagellar basal body rod protein FlgB n=1 Tax=Spongiibacter pelagi TaxID=2760804 RepID=A0A927C254_9GAMM|nr:flagellar basal body rod protein FlgB [Spongiibacter pelagi]MBD2858411.1 flagellar basal body rod protein FlgB [Spongiibacter pelagi]
MAINFDKALGVHQSALFVRQQRSELLATNIANADTPGYKAQDIDFRAALSQANVQQGGLGLDRTSANHIDIQAGADRPFAAQVQYRIPTQPSLDGNTVESHVEEAAFADNAMRYQATLQFLGGRFSSLKNVIQGGR